jgi:ABC-2 type transport system ATP-binding protein
VIVASHLTRRFGSRAAVNDLSLEVGRSEIVALLGPNGAGKTTTLRMLAGLVAPTSGAIAIDGVGLTRSTGSALRARIGFLPESPGLWDRLSVRENLGVYAGLFGLADAPRVVDRLLDEFGLADRADTRAAELSKGMRQKVALARALMHDPDVLLLDEPTSGLDPEITRDVRDLLAGRRNAGNAIVVSTHNLDVAERLSDRVAVLQERLLAVDTPAALGQRLRSGRVRIRVEGDPAAFLDVGRRFSPQAAVDGAVLIVDMPQRVDRTPDLVAALAAGGARIVEVRRDAPDLEDVYLHLVHDT